jgi:GT2 family glycosyltransferase
VLDEYVALDPRIWAKHLPRNLGIARASGHALSLATGDFVALLDHDDELPPEALFCIVELLNKHPDIDLIYTDEDKLDADGQRVEPFFKPDWSPDLLLSMNYITHLSCFRRSQLEEIGGFRQRLDGSQDYDLLLRFTERARRIAHLPKILYHWRKVPGSAAASTAAKPFAYEAGRQALEDAVKRRGRDARVANVLPGVYAVRYSIVGTPLVSIIIPTRDRWPLLQQCLQSIEEKTRYPRYEIIILDNDSCEPESMRGLNAVADKWRVLPYPGPFNFAALNNFGAGHARGDYLVFLNNDTQVLEPDWLGALLEHAQRPEVGAVGARLHYPDGRIQHAGLVLGVGGVADHAFKGVRGDTLTYFALGEVVRNVSAVTGACMMVSRRVFQEIGGFDERLHVALNDVDLCLRLGQRGYLIVYTPFALLYHHESGTRGRLHPPADEELVWNEWGELIRHGDPYYNVNLTLSRTDWSVG